VISNIKFEAFSEDR